jgi:hypothetical protein
MNPKYWTNSILKKEDETYKHNNNAITYSEIIENPYHS